MQKDAGDFAAWFDEAMQYLKSAGNKPSDLDGNPNFLFLDWERGLTPKQSIDFWRERSEEETGATWDK